MGCVAATEDESPTNSMKTIQRHICKKCKVQFNSESSVCPSCDEETAAAAYADYRERCQAGQKTEDDEEIYESHDEVSHDDEVYDDGYKGALKDFARAFGFSDVIPPMESDTLLWHARQLTKYRQGYENIQHERDAERTVKEGVIKNYDIALERNATLKRERDEARAAYQAETLSTADLVKENLRLESKVAAHARTIEKLKTSLEESNELLRIARDQLAEWEQNRVGAKYGQNAAALPLAGRNPSTEPT